MQYTPPLLTLPCLTCTLSTPQGGVSEEEVFERQRKAMSGVPEFCVKDMAVWFRFVVLSRPALLQGLQVCVCVCVYVCVYLRSLVSKLSQAMICDPPISVQGLVV